MFYILLCSVFVCSYLWIFLFLQMITSNLNHQRCHVCVDCDKSFTRLVPMAKKCYACELCDQDVYSNDMERFLNNEHPAVQPELSFSAGDPALAEKSASAAVEQTSSLQLSPTTATTREPNVCVKCSKTYVLMLYANQAYRQCS